MSNDKADLTQLFKSPIFVGIVAFILGAILPIILIVLPMTRNFLRRDALIGDLFELHRQEQARIAEMQDISHAQLREWVSINTEASRRYQEIFDHLRKLETRHSNFGLYTVTLFIFSVLSKIIRPKSPTGFQQAF